MKYSVHVPDVSDYKEKFGADFERAKKKQELEEQERQRAYDQKNKACNQAILDQIAKDTNTYGIRYWEFEFNWGVCEYDPEIATILTKKGYKVKHIPQKFGKESPTRNRDRPESLTVKI